MKVFVSAPADGRVRNSFFTPEACAVLEKNFEVEYLSLDRQLLPEEIKDYAADADVLMTGWGHPYIHAKLLEGTSVKLIAHTGGSVADYVDPDVYEAGIRVISGNELYAQSVAEGAIGYMLMALRRLPDNVQSLRTGSWQIPETSEGLLDQTVGIVGMGTISRYLITMLKPFGAQIKIYSGHAVDTAYLQEHNAQQVSLEEIFSTCKIVTLHNALNDRTRGMIGKKHFDLLRDGALFLNTARGAIVREDEMIEALQENRFRAVLDVYCKEPLAVDSPLRSMSNVYCIPHQGGPTVDRRPWVVKALAEDIQRYAMGEALRHEIAAAAAKRMTRERTPG